MVEDRLKHLERLTLAVPWAVSLPSILLKGGYIEKADSNSIYACHTPFLNPINRLRIHNLSEKRTGD